MSESITVQELQKDRLIEVLHQARDANLGRAARVNTALSLLDSMTRSKEGLLYVYSIIEEIIEADLFRDTSWQDMFKLEPTLVRGTLCAGFPGNTYEILSELRLLYYAENGSEKEQAFAGQFLEEAIISSFDLAFRDTTEQVRSEITDSERKRIRNLLQFVMSKIPTSNLKHKLAEEMLDVSAQRPILTHRLEELAHLAKLHFDNGSSGSDHQMLRLYINALYGPTERARSLATPEVYKAWLENVERQILEEEAIQTGESMYATGLVSEYQFYLVSELEKRNPDLVGIALHLTSRGKAELEENQKLVMELIRSYINPENRQALFSLAGVLNRNLLSRKPIRNAIIRFFRMSLDKDIVYRLASGDEKLARERLLAGVLGVLGQPLGIGQGNNPTCQSARGISMWSSHSPAKLLDMIFSAAAHNQLTFRFEGELVRSRGLHRHKTFDFYLDPVSMILVPHLDFIYQQMMQKAQFKYPHKDPHISVNPAFYGHWIQTGFISAYSHILRSINQYNRFVRVFYASFHPVYNGNHFLVYPVPLGVFITNAHADLLGFHAISLLRVKKDETGEWRAYFYNPNNEGRQNWGQDIRPTVRAHGEQAGESSLPFHQLVSRVYAFHYNSINIRDKVEDVTSDIVKKVRDLAVESWGRNYTWQ